MWAEAELQPRDQGGGSRDLSPWRALPAEHRAHSGTPTSASLSRELPEATLVHPGGNTWLNLKHSSWVPMTDFEDRTSCQDSWDFCLIFMANDSGAFGWSLIQANPCGAEHQGTGHLPNHTCPRRAWGRKHGKGSQLRPGPALPCALVLAKSNRAQQPRPAPGWAGDGGLCMEQGQKPIVSFLFITSACLRQPRAAREQEKA